jgi:nuclear pore complex protein Nup133
MFPLSNEMANETDSALDRLVVSMSADLIDDFPASDPRWLKTVPGAEAAGGVGSTMSLLILHQLEDKQTALEVYISFLKEVGLWRRVRTKLIAQLLRA